MLSHGTKIKRVKVTRRENLSRASQTQPFSDSEASSAKPGALELISQARAR